MRMIFSVATLPVAAFLVMNLAPTQTRALRQTATAASGPAPAWPAARAADPLDEAVEHGAAQRAGDTASQ